MGDDRHRGVVRGDLGHERQAEEHRRDHHGADAFVLRERELFEDDGRRAHEIRHVDRLAARVLVRIVDRLLAGAYAILERVKALVGQAVIVLDDVDAGVGKKAAKERQALRAQADRLQRGAGQGAVVHVGDVADAGGAELRARERLLVIGPVLWLGQFEVGEQHMLLQRGVAEEDVEELGRVTAGGADGKVDNDDVLVGWGRRHRNEPADNIVEDELVAQRGAGQFDRLLKEQRLDSCVEVDLSLGGDVISHPQGGPGGGGSRKHGNSIS